MTNDKKLVTNNIIRMNSFQRFILPLSETTHSMKHKRITLYIDLLFCLVIIPMVIALLPVERWLVHSVSCFVALTLYTYGLYITYRTVHLTQLILQKKFLTSLGIIFVLVIVTIVLTHIPFQIDFSDTTPEQKIIRQGLKRQTFWFFFLIVSGFSLSIELAIELFKEILAKQEIEAGKDKAELALYKSQINPHFLFNTLNTLYALVICKSKYTESAFVNFSNILRYTYSQVGEEMVPISQEMDYIEQYIELQKLRLNKHTSVRIETDIDEPEKMIPPMILITFVENAFKYGNSSEKDCEILISVKLTQGHLVFKTQNAIMRQREEDDTAVGLENCRKRLSLQFKDKYTLETRKEKGIYRTNLTIELT